jgi:glutamine synthetase
MLHATRLGVEAGMQCPEPQVGDGDSEPNTDRHAPERLVDALEALEADTAMCEAMGTDLVRAYTALRRYELGRWEAGGDTWDPQEIGEWELAAYLPYY